MSEEIPDNLPEETEQEHLGELYGDAVHAFMYLFCYGERVLPDNFKQVLRQNRPAIDRLAETMKKIEAIDPEWLAPPSPEADAIQAPVQKQESMDQLLDQAADRLLGLAISIPECIEYNKVAYHLRKQKPLIEDLVEAMAKIDAIDPELLKPSDD